MSFRSLQLLPKSSRYVAAIVTGVMIVGTLLTTSVYRFVSRAEEEHINAEFSRRADVRSALAREVLDYYKSGVYALRSLFEGSDAVSREEFHYVASDILKRYPGIAALEWVPIVKSSGRSEVERQLSAELGESFHFTDMAADGTMVIAPERAEHFPVWYVEPLRGNERALGLDVQSARSSLFLHRARTTGDFVVSSQFELVQKGVGLVMAWPVFSTTPGHTDRVCKGFVQGVFRVSTLLEQTHLRSPTDSLEMLYLDDTAELPAKRVLHYLGPGAEAEHGEPVSEATFRQGLHREYPITLGGRRWLALYRPSKEWLAEQHNAHPEFWLLAGLLITGLFAGLVSAMARRTAAIEREVTERTAELDESRRQLASLLDALPGMAYRCTSDDRMTAKYFSDGAFSLTGYRPDEFLSGDVHFRDLIHADDLERVRLLTRAGLDTQSALEIEYRIHPRTGPEKWVLSRGRCVHSNGGVDRFFEGLAIDITARKLAESEKIAIERKLLESQKLESLGLLAGGIAHDFNNLLTGIMGHANLARFAPGISPEIAEHLLKIESGAVRAAELCQQMLAYSGRGHFVVEPVDLNLLIQDTLPLLKGSVPARARLELSLSSHAAMVTADATQLRQIVMNLVLNAADAVGAAGGTIAVTSSRRRLEHQFFATARVGGNLGAGEYVVLEVSDTGCGMAADTLAKIFDPFFTTKFTGRGLGLAAVLGIVRGHSGALFVTSEIGQGTTFTLVLPECASSSRSRATEAADAPWRQSGRILVIDDEASVREVAAQLIRTFGFTVTTANDGADGIRQFQASPTGFSVVLLDMTMPGMDGVETLTKLRIIHPAIRVLLISGYSEAERVAGLAVHGPVLFVQKPFTRAKLQEKLREILM